MKEIEIVKWVVRIEEKESVQGKNGKAVLVGLDKDGNEYQMQYYDSAMDMQRHQDIIVTETPSIRE